RLCRHRLPLESGGPDSPGILRDGRGHGSRPRLQRRHPLRDPPAACQQARSVLSDRRRRKAMRLSGLARRGLAAVTIATPVLLVGSTGTLLGVCGPFTDVSAFCSEVLEIFYLGITTGTTATTYDPASNVSRLQMAIFLSRSADRLLQRGSRRAALKQFWTPQNAAALSLTTVGANPFLVESDGADLWVANGTSGTVSRVRGSDGKLLETWTGASSAAGVLVAMGSVFVTGFTLPTGRLYLIDPSQPAGAVTTVASGLGLGTFGIAFDGFRIWTANGNN